MILTIAFCSCLSGNLRMHGFALPSPLEFYFLSWNKARLRELPSEATLLAWLLCAADSHVGAWREALR